MCVRAVQHPSVQWKMNETNYVPIASDICGVKAEHARLKCIKPTKKLSRQNGLFLLAVSLLIRGIKMGEISKRAGWSDWLIMPFGPIPFISCECGRGYVGETCRHLAIRLREHKHSLKEGIWEKSKLVQHSYEECHKVNCDEAWSLGIESNSRYKTRNRRICRA
jgi:hypothetical protein